MKNRFKAISIVLSLTLLINLFINTYEVKATPLIEGPTPIFPWYSWSIESLKGVGMIYDPERVPNLPSISDLKQQIETNDPEANISETDESINEYINNNITTNNEDNSITYNDKSKFVLKYINNYLMDQTGDLFAYSLNFRDFRSYIENGYYYAAMNNLLAQYQADYYIATFRPKYDYCIAKIYPKSNWVWILDGVNNTNNTYTCSLYKRDTWERVSWQNDGTSFIYDGNTKEFIEGSGTWNNSWNNASMILGQQPDVTFTLGNPTYCCFTTNTNYQYKIYRTINDFKTEIEENAPYYISDKYYDFSSSNGDYTVDTSNSNNITYGDIINYINSQDTRPSDNNIYNYINNNIPYVEPTPTPTPDNPSGAGGSGGSATANANNEGINININNNHSLIIGGSSLSGNTVSGNGSGESGSGGIFDFLGQIGHTIGNFVKNIGQVLADIVTGLGEVVSSLLESIPTIFGDFLGALIGWLPTELQALITLSITAMILVGLIKLFRG